MHFVLHMASFGRTAQNRCAWVGQAVNRGSAQFQREADRCDEQRHPVERGGSPATVFGDRDRRAMRAGEDGGTSARSLLRPTDRPVIRPWIHCR